MFEVVLVAPQIAANTGNIIRLCANAGARLHLVPPLGFTMDDTALRRAGLDYHELASVTVHADAAECRRSLGAARRFTFSSRASVRYSDVELAGGDVFVFGAERAGLTREQREAFAPATDVAIPMRPGNRSLNLANAVAIVVYEAWRRQGYDGASTDATSTAETLRGDPFDA